MFDSNYFLLTDDATFYVAIGMQEPEGSVFEDPDSSDIIVVGYIIVIPSTTLRDNACSSANF